MKKPLFLLLTLFLMCAEMSGQKLSTDKVPTAVKTNFQQKYSDAKNVKWELENASEYEVTFSHKGKEMSSKYASNGDWMETETEIQKENLPPNALHHVQTEFRDFKIEDISLVENKEYGTCYEIDVEKGKVSFELLYNADGKFIQKTIEKED